MYETHGETEGMFPQDTRCIGYKGISTWESVSVADVNSNSYPPHIFSSHDVFTSYISGNKLFSVQMHIPNNTK